jgi:hypothetical protein
MVGQFQFVMFRKAVEGRAGRSIPVVSRKDRSDHAQGLSDMPLACIDPALRLDPADKVIKSLDRLVW